MKFGGSSVADADRIRQLVRIVESKKNDHDKIFVVVSAFGGVTDELLSIIQLAESGDEAYRSILQKLFDRINSICDDLLPDTSETIKDSFKRNQLKLKNVFSGVFLIREASAKTKDYILSFGERNSAFLVASYLSACGQSAKYVDARKYIKTNNSFGSALVKFSETNQLIEGLSKEDEALYVVTGFIGSDLESGRTTTLGRGGSDYTASIFAAASNSDALEIWTDVDGVLTSDPRKVKNAYTINELSYSEALEMSHFGAKVLYAPTIRPVREKSIPTWIKNSFNPTHPGTVIRESKTESSRIVTGLSSIPDICLISIQGPGLQGVTGIASRFFSCLAQGNINIVMITQASSEHSISVAIKSQNVSEAILLINTAFAFELDRKLIDPVQVQKGLSLLAVVGENMKNRHGVAGKLFNTLGKNGVNIEAISQGSSELNITFAVRSEQESKALNTIHDSFFLSEYKTVHLFVVGTGLIGSKLLELIDANHQQIKERCGIDLVINGISNSTKNYISGSGMSARVCREKLNALGSEYNMEKMVQTMIDLNLANSIFIDNTAHPEIPNYYPQILSNNIAISTPNKIAMSSELGRYNSLKALSHLKNTPFKFETNVAAGLPVISTLENLINSGDQITRIEAVLSGSLSYIFNSFTDSEDMFVDWVKSAQKLGLTEPDPREDLSGSDIKRKLLILARESGFNLSEETIKVRPLISEKAVSAPDVEAFYSVIKSENGLYQSKLVSAQNENKRLRVIASSDGKSGEIALTAVSEGSPFYNLSGSDNMIVFHSERYSKTPLVIRGPGAGADVTAAGVLAEIINIGNTSY